MCGHEFLYRDRYRVQRHTPVWQCGTCGRVSQFPLDCCARPDAARRQPAVLTQIFRQWLSGCGRWTLASVRPLWRWQRQPADSAGQILDSERLEGLVTTEVQGPTAASDESSEAEDMAVAAGERV
jgi:hypothetical protein